jgi:ClpP class serine protease
MTWDIASGTGLAIHLDVLPEDAPQTLLRDLPVAAPESFTRQDNVAVIDIVNVITPYANILSALFGGTDIQSVTEQFLSAMDDPDIAGVVLRIDSPGGLITGVEELATTIAGMRGQKPIIAYAYGNAASAAYWIASAADTVVAGRTTSLGSIGVAMAVPKEKDSRWVKFVSSNAPRKRLDPESAEGQDAIQRRVDAMEREFISAIARFRDVPEETVAQDFGQGDVLPAREAVRLGMADMLGNFSDALALIFTHQRSQKGDAMSKQSNQPSGDGNDNDMIARDQVTADFLQKEFPKIAQTLVNQGREEAMKEGQEEAQKKGFDEGHSAGAKAERERILALEDAALPGHDQLVADAKKDGETTAEGLALKIVAVERQRGNDVLQSMKKDADRQPEVGPSVDPEQSSQAVDENAPIEERAAAEWDRCPQTRSEFAQNKDAYIAYRKAEEEGRVKRFAK